MSTAQSPAPTITNAGTRPATPRKLFLNIAVSDVQRSIIFFESLGFTFNRQFTDATGTCMVVGEDAYFMLLTRERFGSFTDRPVGDPRRDTTGMFALSAASRAEVDELAERALAAGGTPAMPAQDHGLMFGRSFYDLDGHHWEVFWMDPSAIPA